MYDEAHHSQLVADIVAAYVSNNSVPMTDLAALITSVHSSLKQVATGESVAAPVAVETKPPAVPVKKSVTNDFIICLEDGMKFKSLRRHLAAKFDLTPDAYRAKWGLPQDYPMVAPAYSATRSSLAKQIGLGRSAAASGGKPRQAAGKKTKKAA